MITNLEDIGKDFKKLAVEKIDRELKEFVGDKYGKAVHTYVANVLRDFCEQNERFAEVVYKTKRSLSDCCAEIMKGCGSHISDIEVYRRATKLYFPNSEIEGVMRIVITGDAPDEKYLEKEPQKKEAKKSNGKTSGSEYFKELKEREKSSTKTKTTKPAKPSKPKEPEVIQLSLF